MDTPQLLPYIQSHIQDLPLRIPLSLCFQNQKITINFICLACHPWTFDSSTHSPITSEAHIIKLNGANFVIIVDSIDSPFEISDKRDFISAIFELIGSVSSPQIRIPEFNMVHWNPLALNSNEDSLEYRLAKKTSQLSRFIEVGTP